MTKTARWFLQRGIAAGAAGGAAAALFLRFITETQIDAALRFEDATGIGLPPGEAAEFSRPTQQWGGMAAAVLYGVILGIILAVVVAAFHHRVTGRNEFERIGKISLAGFVAIVLIPALKYPPNPPAVGDPDTIGDRSLTFMLLLLASVVVVYGMWRLWGWLTDRGWEGAPRFAVGGGAAVLVVTFLLLSWPATPDAIVPPDNAGAPALEISADAPPEVLAQALATARANEDGWIRDPAAPDQPLDLSRIEDPQDLVGAPAALSTTKLVPGAYTTIVWHFRLQSIAGLAVLWVVMATVFGLLADRRARTLVDA